MTDMLVRQRKPRRSWWERWRVVVFACAALGPLALFGGWEVAAGWDAAMVADYRAQTEAPSYGPSAGLDTAQLLPPLTAPPAAPQPRPRVVVTRVVTRPAETHSAPTTTTRAPTPTTTQAAPTTTPVTTTTAPSPSVSAIPSVSVVMTVPTLPRVVP